MGADLSLRLEATREELPRMQAVLEAFAREEGWPSRLEFQIKLVIEEVVMNILSHGYEEGGDHDILIELASDGEKIGIEIVDDGRPYDPLTEAPAPDTEAPLADRPVGGLGVYLVCALMDEAGCVRLPV